MALKVARVIGALLVAGSLATLIGAVSEHDSERARWSLERSRIDDPAYDARASDRAYARSRIARRNAGWAGLALMLGIWIVLVGERREQPTTTRPLPTLGRNLASLVDLALVVAVGALAAIDDGESALLHALAWAAPVAGLATHAIPLGTRGRTLGMALFGARGSGVGPGRALLASILLPLAIVGVLRPSWSAPHWRLVGVAPRADAE